MMMSHQTQLAGTSDLVQTKLVPPQLRPQLVARAALLGRLDAGLSCKLTLVSAPAGFGKTTLARQWIARLRLETGEWRLGERIPASSPRPLASHVAWVALDAGDNDLIRFWRYLLAALAHHASDDPLQAQNTLCAALAAGQPQGYIMRMGSQHESKHWGNRKC